MKNLSIVLCSALILAGCMSSPVKQGDSRECVRNFSKKGFLNYQTTVTLPGVKRDLAMKRLVRKLGRLGFSINDQDSSEGFVGATFDAGKGGFQLSAFFENIGKSTKVELNYKGTGVGFLRLFIPTSAYMNDLCDYAEAMSSQGS